MCIICLEFGLWSTWIWSTISSKRETDIARVVWARFKMGCRKLPKETAAEWIKWKDKLSDLQSVHIKRCFMPPTFGKVKDCSLHYFWYLWQRIWSSNIFMCSGWKWKSPLYFGNGKAQTSCTTEIHNHTKNGTCCCNTISKNLCDAIKSLNFHKKYFGQIVQLFWVTSETNQESSTCLLQIELKLSEKIPVTPSGFM